VGAIVDSVHEEEDFKKLFVDLVFEYDPQGRLEELLVERIATAFWKLKRVIDAEQGEIKKAMDAATDRLRSDSHENMKDIADWVKVVFMNEAGHHSTELIRSLKRTEEGVTMLADLARRVRNELENTDSISKRAWHFLVRGLDDDFHMFIDQEGSFQNSKEQKQIILDILDRKIADLNWLNDDLRERASREKDSEYQRVSIPEDVAMDRILRYERHAERQLYRAMDQLERLQRKRRGEFLPLPLKLEIERN